MATSLFKFVILLKVLLNLTLVRSFELIKFKNLNEEQLLAKLTQILDQNDDQSVEYVNHIALRGNRRDLRDAHNKFQRRRLIKTIIPYCEKVKFVTQSESLYKTLKRIHKKQKPIFVKDKDGYKIKFDSVSSSKGGSVEIRASSPKQKIHNVKHNRITAEDFSQFWEKLKSLKYKYKKQKLKENNLNSNKKHLRSIIDINLVNLRINTTYVKERFSKFWQNIEEAYPALKNKTKPKNVSKKLISMLDTSGESLRTRSGEEHDPLAPGRVPFNFEMYESTTKKSSNWLPYYSFWNYWTYDKALHQDSCKGSLIKVGDKCIGSPPH